MMTDEEQDEHNQLPDVEEYKAGIGHREGKGPARKFISSTANNDPEGHRMDPDGIVLAEESSPPDQRHELYDSTSNRRPDKTNFGHMEVEQRRDPDLVAEKRKSVFWKVWTVSVVLIIVIIVTIVLVLPDDEKLDFYHWIHGDTEAYIAVRDYVTNLAQLSEPDVFGNKTSPQYLAAQWIAHGDGMHLSVPESRDRVFEQRYALVVFYFSLGGPGWTSQLNFLSGAHVCAWFEESPSTEIYGNDVLYGVHKCTTRDDEMYPHSMSLRKWKISVGRFRLLVEASHNGLVGTIPNEISVLEGIEYLNLESNEGLTGSSLPKGLSELTSLTHLQLRKCSLYGKIPTWIGQMTDLRYLSLGSNDFSGFVPHLESLVALEFLGLDDNTLSGNIQLFQPLSGLKSLYLDHNYLSGTISEDLWLSWPNLKELSISDCVLTGRLPSTFFSGLNNLEVIDLHHNEMDGPLPDEVDFNTNLQYLGLHENTFSGTVPQALSNFKSLKHLDLSTNRFTSTLPHSLGQLTALEYLSAGKNEEFLPQEMPSFLMSLPTLRCLSLDRNNLTGNIPSWIDVLSNLEVLDLRKSKETFPPDPSPSVRSILRLLFSSQ
eukprot:scaffold22593_cov145-Cylindrotheca_fusiformis.AAC.8